MRAVNKLGTGVLALLYLASSAVLIAQTSEKLAPTFALAIEEGQLSAQAGYQPTDHELLVKYTNISDVVQKDDCVVTPAAYKMVVLRDGLPAEKRKTRSKNTDESQDSGKTNGYRIKTDYTEADMCNGITRGIDPGKVVKFTLWVSSEYDMTVPGTYEITVTRETDRWNPNKSVTIRSNTITIVVPPPPASAQQ
jgi:hypothetical protein